MVSKILHHEIALFCCPLSIIWATRFNIGSFFKYKEPFPSCVRYLGVFSLVVYVCLW